MSSDISRVYAFLAKQGDWVSDADKNGDGVIIKTEFVNFMEENFEWDGETTDAGKNDLINNFWKTIDTTQSGNVSGTRLKNKNALDKKEIAAMNNRIEVYEALNEYTSGITAPAVIGDTANWKKSVSEGLGALVEGYIKSGGTADGLAEFLDGKRASIEAKATADYCAQEYLADVMGDVVKEYGYAYGDDKTLQGMINKYIQNLPSDVTPEEIQQTVQNMINAYMSTAGLNEEGIEDLKEFGYTPTANSPLNDLQKSIIQSKLQKAIESGSFADKYNDYKTMFDEAITKFMNNLKFGNFATINEDVLGSFTASSAYKNVTKAIDTKAVFNSDELKSALRTAIGDSFADRISGIMTGELPAYDKMIEEAMTKAQNGEFDAANGELDTQKLIKWITQQVKSNLAEFYPNGFGNMPLEELNTMYDALVASAKENQDAEKIKEAAISYCKAVSAKGSALAQAVKDIFGDSYASAINKLLSSEIDAKMEDLKAKVLEIGDVSTFTVDSWSGISDSLQMDGGKSASYAINTSIKKPDGTPIDASRITYTVSSSIATVNNGTITINAPSQAGYYSIKIQAMVDGVAVGEAKTIKLTVRQSAADTVAGVKGWDGQVSEHLETYNINDGKQVTNSSFADLYNNDAIIRLDNSELKKDRSEWNKGRKDLVTERLTQLGNLIVSALATSGLDKSKLQQAMETVKNRYVSSGPIEYWEDHHSITGNTIRQMNNNRNSYGHRIVAGYDDDGNTEACYAIRFKDFVDDILTEYWKLVG